MTVLIIGLIAAAAVIGYVTGYEVCKRQNALTEAEKKALDGFVNLMSYDGSNKKGNNYED